MGDGLYFKNKRNHEKIIPISKLVMNLPLWWRNTDNWLRQSRDMLILIECHKIKKHFCQTNCTHRQTCTADPQTISAQGVKYFLAYGRTGSLYSCTDLPNWWMYQKAPKVWSNKHILLCCYDYLSYLSRPWNGTNDKSIIVRSSATLVSRAKRPWSKSTRTLKPHLERMPLVCTAC